MKPINRLKKIESKGYAWGFEDKEWLISRVKRLTTALEFYSDGRNFETVFENESGTRAQIFEKYKEYSISDLGLVAREALEDG